MYAVRCLLLFAILPLMRGEGQILVFPDLEGVKRLTGRKIQV